MQDLSSYQSDSINTGPGTAQSAAAQHQPRTMMRSKSENYNKGEVASLLVNSKKYYRNGLKP